MTIPTEPTNHARPEGAEDDLQVRLSEVRERLAEADLAVRTFVRDHPVLSVAGAVAAGYLAGRIVKGARRWRRT